MEEEKGVKQDMEEEGETFLMVEVEEEEKTIIKEEQLEEAIWPCLLPGEYLGGKSRRGHFNGIMGYILGDLAIRSRAPTQ